MMSFSSEAVYAATPGPQTLITARPLAFHSHFFFDCPLLTLLSLSNTVAYIPHLMTDAQPGPLSHCVTRPRQPRIAAFVALYGH